MEKDIGKIRKNDNTDIVLRIDDFGGKVGLTIREFNKSDRYTGFTKSGTRIPAESISEFKELINSIDENEIQEMSEKAQAQPRQISNQQNYKLEFKSKDKPEKSQKKLMEDEELENSEESSDIEEETF